MPLDPKLRDVLDFLPCEPCLERPSPDQEVLCSICHRLNRTVALRCQVSLVTPTERAPSQEELEAAREEARLKQAEFEALQGRQEADDENVARLRAERDELLERQRELEDRLARLEAQSHGGHLTFVDEGPSEPVEDVVEFSRVDLAPRPVADEEEADEDEVMEFQSLGSETTAFSAPDEEAWEEGSAWEDQPSWEEPAEETAPEAAGTEAGEAVSWDDIEETEPAYGETEEAPWETVEDGTDWAAQEAEQQGRAHAQTEIAPDEEEEEFSELDERTRADLSELEAQLEELESELAKRRRREQGEE